MRPFFSREGDAALCAAMDLRPLLAFDFDGTLAPIVDHPDDARVPDEVGRCLGRLAARLPVAVITGRSSADVRSRLNFEPTFVVGSHGIENGDDPPAAAARAIDFLRERIARQSQDLAAVGVGVEDKRYSLALHYRQAADPAAARARIDSLLRGVEPMLQRFGGKQVVNIVAAGTPDKGDALAALVARCSAAAAVFAGDDLNDEAVFARVAPPSLTIRVGCDEPASQAMYFVDDEPALARVLHRMLELQVAR